MLICILVLAIIVLIVFVKLSHKYNYKDSSIKFTIWDFSIGMSFLSGAIALAMVISICCFIPMVATEGVLDSEIAMYQEENAKIEKDIDRIVKDYLEYNHDTFADLKTEESSITLVKLFPELKSNTLVQKQLTINAKIKSLKKAKINLSTIRWILYFGK